MIKLIDIILEWSYSQLYSKTPNIYKDRARDIRVKLKTVTPKGKYHYETRTISNGELHNQWIKPRPNNKIKSINDNVLVWCSCENFTYENEWLLWKNNSSHIVNSNGLPTRIKNPKRILKLCKHLVSVMDDFKKRI